MKWLNAVIKRAFDVHMRKVLRDMEQPEATQERVFQQLLKLATKTEFGKKYDFTSIHSVSEFQQRVPVHSYEDVKPYIERMMKGEPNLLCPGKVTYFSRSSGTTNNKSKYSNKWRKR